MSDGLRNTGNPPVTEHGRKVRRDVTLHCLRRREWRLALTVWFMPSGYSITKTEARKMEDLHV